MKKNIIISFILLICIIGCDPERGNSNNDALIVSVNPDDSEKKSLIDFSNEIKLIKLNHADSFYINHVTKILLHENKMYIFDQRGQSVFIYDQQGNPFKMIHDVGHGPNEYAALSAIAIDQNEKLILIDNNLKKKSYYTLDGDFLHKEDLPFRVKSMGFKDNEEVLIRSIVDANDNKGFRINISNRDNSYRFIPFEYINGTGVTDDDPLVVTNDCFYFSFYFNDTIYKYTPDHFRPEIVMDYQGHGIPSDIMNAQPDQLADKFYEHIINNSKTAFAHTIIDEKDDIALVTYLYPYNGRHYVLYDIKNEMIVDVFYGPYLNDISIWEICSDVGGIEGSNIYFILDQYKISQIDDAVLKNNLESTYPDIYKFIKDLEIEDNPALLSINIENIFKNEKYK